MDVIKVNNNDIVTINSSQLIIEICQVHYSERKAEYHTFKLSSVHNTKHFSKKYYAHKVVIGHTLLNGKRSQQLSINDYKQDTETNLKCITIRYVQV